MLWKLVWLALCVKLCAINYNERLKIMEHNKLFEKELLKQLNNPMDDFLKEVAEKQSCAAFLLYYLQAVSEHITFQECIKKYEVKEVGDQQPILVNDYPSKMAYYIQMRTQMRLTRRAPIDIEPDILNRRLDETALGFVELLERKLNIQL